MALRVTYIAIAMGGMCGALAALVGSPSTSAPASAELPSPMGNLPLRPIAELGRAASSASAARSSAARSSASAARSSAAPASATPTPSPSAVPATSSAAAASLPALPALPAPADTAPPPDTKAALLRAEMHCDQRDGAACILAARAYEAGSAGPADAEKAAKYRRIALTMWISQCDHNSAPACATLADMYRAGRGVPQSQKNADALLARTRELCHYNDAPVCHELPPAP